MKYTCPYCHSSLTDADTTRDGEALRCAECGERVEYFDALEAEAVNWFGDSELQCCVASDGDTYVIFTAGCNGVLTITGDNWKKRKWPPRLSDQATAMRIAEGIVRTYL